MGRFSRKIVEKSNSALRHKSSLWYVIHKKRGHSATCVIRMKIKKPFIYRDGRVHYDLPSHSHTKFYDLHQIRPLGWQGERLPTDMASQISERVGT